LYKDKERWALWEEKFLEIATKQHLEDHVNDIAFKGGFRDGMYWGGTARQRIIEV